MAAKKINPQMHFPIDTIYRYFPELKIFVNKLWPYYETFRSWVFRQKIYVIFKVYFYVLYDYLTEINISENQALQGCWLLSHSATLLFSLRFILQLIKSGTWNTLNYQIALTSAVFTYTLVSYRHLSLISRKSQKNGILSLTRSENTFLLVNAIIAFNSGQNIIKLLPFAMYSFLNIYIVMLDEYFNHTLTAKILMPYIGVLEERILKVCSLLEVLLVPIYGIEMFQSNNKGFLVYFLIIVLRLESSEYIPLVISELVNIIQGLCANKFQGFFSGVRLFTVYETQSTKSRVASLNFDST